MKIRKGDYGYIRREKKKRLLVTLGLFVLPAIVFIVGLVLADGNKSNIFTVVAVVGCLPGCRAAVGFIMMVMQKSVDKAVYDAIEAKKGKLLMGYEMYITQEKSSLMIEAAAFCGEEIACYTTRAKDQKQIEDCATYLNKIIRANGYKCHVKIFDREKAFRVFKIGGAQAIAALAYGTESIPKVDKIVGPGNIYVALAKKAVYGNVSIDSIAGPSEILVLADETANPRFVAADLLSQAEHDELASAILITTSQELAEKVSEEVNGFLKVLSRSDIISKSLDNFGYILVTDSHQEAIDTVDAIAPEHLEIVTKNPFEDMMKVHNAGAIFLGENSSEPLGDYFAGPNHILPTNGTAKFFSPLSVDDFVKKSSIIYYSREALSEIHEDIESFAKSESLTAHANSIAVRFEGEE